MPVKVKPAGNVGNRKKSGPAKDNVSSSFFSKKVIMMILMLATVSILTFITFYPSLNNDLTNWDDNVYITENTFINELHTENLKQIFTTPVSLNYHPLTMLTIAIDYQRAFNRETKTLSAAPFHETNIIIHIFNALLVFWFIYLLSGRNIAMAFIVSVFFGIHPLRVESVSWVSERKDVLYAFFYILSLIFYLKFLDTSRYKHYFIVLLLFILSLLSKGMAMTLPLLMIAIDYYKGTKFSAITVLQKVPFFVLSVIFGIVALKIQSHGALGEFNAFNIFERFLISCYGLCMYLFKLVFPFNLCSFYPYPFAFVRELVKFPVIFYICPFIVAGITLSAWLSAKYTRLIVFGLLFYLFSVSIVLQFVSVGIVIIADRYTYIPYIGLFYMIAGLYKYLDEKPGLKLAGIFYSILLLAFVFICSVSTFNRTKVWKNSLTLWTDVINKYPEQVETSYLNRGNFYAKELSDKNPFYLDSAMADYLVLMKMNRANHNVYSTIGNVYAMKGRFEESIKSYGNAIRLDSTDYKVYINRALTYMKLKRYDLSLRDLEKTITMYDGRQPHVLLAYAVLMTGDYSRSAILYSRLTRDYPDYTDAWLYRGVSYSGLKEYDKAMIDFNYFLKFNQKLGETYYYIANVYFNEGKYNEANQFIAKSSSNGFSVAPELIKQVSLKLKVKK